MHTLLDVIDTPWRAWNEMRRLVASPFIRLGFAVHGVAWGRQWRVFGMPVIQRHRRSRISLGDRVELRSWRTANPLSPVHPVVLATRGAGSVIAIGDDCGFTGATIVAATRVEIGNRVLVGANTTIVDTDFHPLDAAARRRDVNAGTTAPVIIEDDVFIGMNCIILKGVRIGAGAAIGAGSVVSRDVPAGAIAAGNPARVVTHGAERAVEAAQVAGSVA